MSCLVCGSESLRPDYESPRLQVSYCSSCGHRVAEHGVGGPTNDYYEHTPAHEKYVASLSATRRRQATAVLRQLTPRLAPGDPWLDFGCGRGLFLEEARRYGLTALAGFEASAVARDWMKGRNFEMAAAMPGEFWPDWRSLTAAPRVVSVFDVLEHFRGASALRVLPRLREELPGLAWVVLKVPVSEGALFRLAHRLRHGIPGLYETLFQVGTNPPHFHYFSRRSLRRVIERAGFRLEVSGTDPDVDNLFHRIPPLSFLPGGRLAALALRALPGDTEVVYTVPTAKNG